jgi:hypothetical protein
MVCVEESCLIVLGLMIYKKIRKNHVIKNIDEQITTYGTLLLRNS